MATEPPRQLPLCPDSPNCVSSQARDPQNWVEPVNYAGSGEKALSNLARRLETLPRVRVVESTGHWLHAEFTSLIFRFVDDVHLALDESAKVIHIRSASRVGFWDLGANRRRVEKIRGLFAAPGT